jgi:diguanylate cyclase (GGDEF)-like protein
VQKITPIVRGSLAAVGRALPRGGTLPRADWERRHRVLVLATWACLPVLAVYSFAEGYPLWHTGAHLAAIIPLSVLASAGRLGRKERTAAISLALLTVCALLIHMSGGLIEMHFSFFVVIVVLTIYEDWTVFLLAIAFVLIHHGVMGMVEPHDVFNRPDAWEHPWKWALIHSLFVTLAGAASVMAWRLNEDVRVRMYDAQRELEQMSLTDALTGLANRRMLMADLAAVVDERRPALLMLLDLNGFKDYNDSYGHVVGDSLLERLGAQLREAVEPTATAYRLGGDEFCVIAPLLAEDVQLEYELSVAAALSDVGDAFTVTSSYGSVRLPEEARVVADALRLADQRMYAEKNGTRASAGRQSSDMLVQVLTERVPELGMHGDGVARLATAVGERMGLAGEDLEQLTHAAQLHDVGKIAIPDAIIGKPAALDASEWQFMRQHTVIGQRIIAAAPALARVGEHVRSSHERWDGGGYPDGLRGEEIPLAARIVSVCDAYDAMISTRPYDAALSREEALVELARCAGTQFDPAVVAAFCATLQGDSYSGSGASSPGHDPVTLAKPRRLS